MLDEIELRRNDTGFLDTLGARSIPNPTTASDFCRRFTRTLNEQLMDLVSRVRVAIWQRQPQAFFAGPARIDADGTVVGTTGESKEWMDLSYNNAASARRATGRATAAR